MSSEAQVNVNEVVLKAESLFINPPLGTTFYTLASDLNNTFLKITQPLYAFLPIYHALLWGGGCGVGGECLIYPYNFSNYHLYSNNSPNDIYFQTLQPTECFYLGIPKVSQNQQVQMWIHHPSSATKKVPQFASEAKLETQASILALLPQWHIKSVMITIIATIRILYIRIVCILTHLILTTIFWGKYCDSLHFTDQEMRCWVV